MTPFKGVVSPRLSGKLVDSKLPVNGDFFLCGGHLVSRQPDRYSELIASLLPSCCW